MKTKILVVEDEVRIARLIRANLEARGYHVAVCGDGAESLHQVDLFDPDIILLDVMLPGLDGFSIVQRIREFSQVPIIMVTAADDPVDRVRGLDLGADDYLVKPFVVEELLARVRAVIRRSRLAGDVKGPSTFHVGPLSIHVAEHKVLRDGQEIPLTPTEFKLLAHLAIHAGRTLTHDELLSHVWGPEYRGAQEYLRVAVARVRRKVEDDPGNPQLIVNIHGVGYRMERPEAQP